MAILAYVLFKVSSGTEREVCQKLVIWKSSFQRGLGTCQTFWLRLLWLFLESIEEKPIVWKKC